MPTPEKVLGLRSASVSRRTPSSGLRARGRRRRPERVKVETTARRPRPASPRGGRDLAREHARFDDLAGKVRALYSPTSSKPVAPPAGLPVFVWFSYGVHGARHRGRRRPGDAVPPGRLARRGTAELLRRVVSTMGPDV